MSLIKILIVIVLVEIYILFHRERKTFSLLDAYNTFKPKHKYMVPGNQNELIKNGNQQ